MRRTRVMALVRGAAIAAIAAIAAGSAVVVPAAASPTASAVRAVPLAAGHVLAAGKLSQPPTTAQCESKYQIACYQVAQLQKAYNLAPLFAKGIQGQGQTIAIVDAFGSPTIASDLKVFDKEMGLPDPPSFKVITPAGPITTTPKTCTATFKPTGPDECSDYYGWTDEASLDVEWAHAMAPKANILLVETPVTETEGIYGFPQIVAAENYVINHHLADVISQSFAANEQTFTGPDQVYSLRSAYFNAKQHGVSVLAASGDNGSTDYICDPASGCANPDNAICCSSTPAVGWPSTDPLVTAIGGTQLHLDAKGNKTSADTVWNDSSTTVGVTGPAYTWGASGGGHSIIFPRPSFQKGVPGTAGGRATPDISMSAAVNGAVDFYDTTDPDVAGWGIVGGTSEATPLFSGIVALADQVAGHRLGDLNPALYALAEHGKHNGILPVTSGTNTYVFCPVADTNDDDSCKSAADLVTVPGGTANGSYNTATGWGTIDAAAFVPALAYAASW